MGVMQTVGTALRVANGPSKHYLRPPQPHLGVASSYMRRARIQDSLEVGVNHQ
jgi:hypothetical protein